MMAARPSGGQLRIVRVSRPKKLVLLLVCLLVVIGASAYATLFDRWPRSNNNASPTVTERNAVAAMGRIEPSSGLINLGAGSPPDRLESLLVERGDLVKKGQVLGYLAGYAEQIAQRDLINAQIEEARLRRDTELKLNQERIRAANLHRRKVLEVTPHRIASQEHTIAALNDKKANSNDILAARELLTEMTQQFVIDQEDATVQVQLARATLDRALAEIPERSLDQQLALAETRTKRLTLYAPIDGRVLNVRVQPGEEVGSGPVLVLGDTSRMRVVAEVYETDIGEVSVGQSATVSSRALLNPISGRVAGVGSMVFKNDVLNVDPAARADARVVEVWIDLDPLPLAERLSNLTVDVLITTSRRDEAGVARR
jgi:HlyD family secretion protein